VRVASTCCKQVEDVRPHAPTPVLGMPDAYPALLGYLRTDRSRSWGGGQAPWTFPRPGLADVQEQADGGNADLAVVAASGSGSSSGRIRARHQVGQHQMSGGRLSSLFALLARAR
jgi:hypothetical protein